MIRKKYQGNADKKNFDHRGTGSFGKAFISKLLTSHPEIERIVIYSRDELKQWN